MNNEQIKHTLNEDTNIVAFYDYGSSVYKTKTEKSDHDIIMIVKDKEKEIDEKLDVIFDITKYSEEEFVELIKEHEISVLECLFLQDENIWKENKKWDFDLDLSSLRHSLSGKSSNSWVKAKKKFTVEKDFNEYIGKKSAWHAIRILDFGIQIAKDGIIKDYSSSNDLLKEIMLCKDWEEINTKFKVTYNAYSSEFKKYAPKELTSINKLKM